MTRREVSRDAGYNDGFAEGRASSNTSDTGLGIVLGAVLFGLIGFGAWFFLGQSSQKPAGTNIINVPSSAPAAPNVNVTVPSPKIEIPSPSLPSSPNGIGNAPASTDGSSKQ